MPMEASAGAREPCPSVASSQQAPDTQAYPNVREAISRAKQFLQSHMPMSMTLHPLRRRGEGISSELAQPTG